MTIYNFSQATINIKTNDKGVSDVKSILGKRL
jgi:hypothetical protein